MTNLHRAWPTEKIIIYTDIDVEPLAVEYPDGGRVADGVGGDVGGDVGGLGGDAVRDEIDLDSDYDEDDENDEEDVKDVEIGARDEEQNVEGDDDDYDNDWLNEGLKGDDLGDDIFAAQNSTPQGSTPNTAPESSNAPHTALESSNAFHVDPEWVKPALEDDLVSMDGFDDEQVEFNAKHEKYCTEEGDKVS